MSSRDGTRERRSKLAGEPRLSRRSSHRRSSLSPGRIRDADRSSSRPSKLPPTSIHTRGSSSRRQASSRTTLLSRRHESKRYMDSPEAMSSEEQHDSEEEQIALDLFDAMDSGSWKMLFERLMSLKESSDDERIARVLQIPDTENKSTLLHTAVWKAPPALTKVLMDIIASTVDPTSIYLSTDADGNTPLHLCCANLPITNDGSVDVSVLKRLAKAAPHALLLANDFGDTPTHMLVSSPTCCNVEDDKEVAVAEEAVTFLLALDEDICRLQDGTGALPLHVAIGCGANEVVLMKLLEAAPTVATAKDECGMLPIHYVAAHGKTPLAVVDFLMEAHPESYTEVTVNGDTPLHILASNAAVSMTELTTQRMDMETEKMIEFLLGSGRDDDSRTDEENVISSVAGNRRPLLAGNKEQV